MSFVCLGRVAETSSGHVALVGAGVVRNELLHGSVEAVTIGAGGAVNSGSLDEVVIVNSQISFKSKPPVSITT